MRDNIRISDLIKFFNVNLNKHDSIYAHKENYIDAKSGKYFTRIKSRESIFSILKVESVLLKQYMCHTYNI
jgi:hypothetical protein